MCPFRDKGIWVSKLLYGSGIYYLHSFISMLFWRVNVNIRNFATLPSISLAALVIKWRKNTKYYFLQGQFLALKISIKTLQIEIFPFLCFCEIFEHTYGQYAVASPIAGAFLHYLLSPKERVLVLWRWQCKQPWNTWNRNILKNDLRRCNELRMGVGASPGKQREHHTVWVSPPLCY